MSVVCENASRRVWWTFLYWIYQPATLHHAAVFMWTSNYLTHILGSILLLYLLRSSSSSHTAANSKNKPETWDLDQIPSSIIQMSLRTKSCQNNKFSRSKRRFKSATNWPASLGAFRCWYLSVKITFSSRRLWVGGFLLLMFLFILPVRWGLLHWANLCRRRRQRKCFKTEG